jgi:hypothetical protein
MKRFIFASFATMAILFPLFGYVYIRGSEDGIAYYKQSKGFRMTLDRMYRYGFDDGRDACRRGK